MYCAPASALSPVLRGLAGHCIQRADFFARQRHPVSKPPRIAPLRPESTDIALSLFFSRSRPTSPLLLDETRGRHLRLVRASSRPALKFYSGESKAAIDFTVRLSSVSQVLNKPRPTAVFKLRINPSSRAGGEGEIRTHGPVRASGFQDRCIQPLCHLSDDSYLTGVSRCSCRRHTAATRPAR